MTQETTPTAVPTTQAERILILDSLRGFAVLGILLMNIPGFAMPRIAFFHPTLMDNFTGVNFYAWYSVEWFLEGSQRALFSMLFGAGMLLFISRLEDRMKGLQPAELYFRRQLWLLFFGLVNAYVLLWFWDILFCYAIFGMLLFAFRRLSPKPLLMAAAACLVLQTARENVDLYRDKSTIRTGEAISRIDTTRTPLTAFQKDRLEEYQGLKKQTSPEAMKERMERNLRDVQGPYARLYANHSEVSMQGETTAIFHFLFFDVLLFMFIGMAFYKNGILTGQHKASTYWILFAGGMGIGLLLSYWRINLQFRYHFNAFDHAKFVAFDFYELSRTFRALGIFGGIMLLHKWGAFRWLFRLMRPVGQMAFTNYLMQSLLCGLFFYGVGFGYFGKLQLYQTYYVVAAVWAIEIVWSHLWLRHFRFGPLEWAWRSLTYWKWQPIRKAPALQAVVPAGKEAEEPAVAQH
ncbi:MAG TPA: DUF418 domain-containing protein [Flavisolibacter sp.]|jgi:uncharacterized protein|nr:DUF418 domain-containing protein [Flavisolibacter sp.]